jgi:putative SOS response-associated peptidase YedK
MLVILDKAEESFWLSKDVSHNDLRGLCDPYPDDQMKAFRVSTDVNAAVVKGVINNRPELMMPVNSE